MLSCKRGKGFQFQPLKAFEIMSLYFPIAEMSLNILLLFAMGGGVGFLSGMFGIGGGFLMTPLLIFTGVPPAVAVATEANQITASSVSGALAHFRRGGIDFKMGGILIVGGGVGAFIGAEIFAYLKSAGQVDILISLSYVFFLGIIGALMFWESFQGYLYQTKSKKKKRRKRHPGWIHAWPLKMKFKKSRLVVSIYIPLLIGALVGILAAIMGVGGGFVMLPAMIYILGMPANVVVGTSLMQIVFVTAIVTFLHSVNTQTVDVLMALILLTGGVIGAQFGARMGYKLKAEQFRLFLAILVLGVCFKMAFDLFTTPEELYTVTEVLK